MALKNGLKGEKHLPPPPHPAKGRGTHSARFLCSLHYLGKTGFASKKAHISFFMTEASKGPLKNEVF
jgi:hypothetical protein